MKLTPKRFGELVKARCKWSGITFCELADIATISKGTLSRIWNGKGNPTLAVMNRIATTLGFEINLKD